MDLVESNRRTNNPFLDLSFLNLTRLPPQVETLSCLRCFYARGNRLTEIPDWLQRLKLIAIDLSGNQITSIPEWFGNLETLEHLDLSWNALRELPNSMLELRRLKTLRLRGNELLNIPTEIANSSTPQTGGHSSPSTILDYYYDTRGCNGVELRELKLIVVGRGRVGKTSLVRRLNGQRLKFRERETHGINISDLSLSCHDGNVTAHVWDFGGQHILHAMHEFFLTARSLYLLVLGDRDDMTEIDAEYWLQLIRSYAKQSPVVVAINKSQGNVRNIDKNYFQKQFGPIAGWIATECAPGFDNSIEILRQAITHAADSMQEVRCVFPKKWSNIKNSLQKMPTPYVSFKSYQALCDEFYEKDIDEQERLAAWLNDLGVAINYSSDGCLHETTILKPDWLANGIYAILRANDVQHAHPLAPNARITSDLVGLILNRSDRLNMLSLKDYPANKWPFLLELMRKFQLAFPLDEECQELLVPSLLPVQPPANCNEPADADRTRLRYEFDVVPAALFPRLLVNTFSLVESDKQWRRGAIYRFGTSKAKVWTTQNQRWLCITAVGNEADRTELVTMLRISIAGLISEYANLRVVEQWEYELEWVPRPTLERSKVLSDHSVVFHKL